jgi:ABC-type siderophore export system fused ATPase/permease subunit
MYNRYATIPKMLHNRYLHRETHTDLHNDAQISGSQTKENKIANFDVTENRESHIHCRKIFLRIIGVTILTEQTLIP